ncbi:MAG: RluA family pseudouridine synthase, partial [Oscillospiraceae bacterium]|nr:RluA family pseudouridine synthase [Oscillospiraceae bacterium]
FVLHTGRTHQIRVHMSYKGYPLAGDDLYGGGFYLMTRQSLHCLLVEFPRPSDKKTVHIEAPIPEDMEKVITKLQNGV